MGFSPVVVFIPLLVSGSFVHEPLQLSLGDVDPPADTDRLQSFLCPSPKIAAARYLKLLDVVAERHRSV